MALATETFYDVNPLSNFAFRPGKSLGVFAGLAVTGVAVTSFAWLIASVTTTQLSLSSQAAYPHSLSTNALAFSANRDHFADIALTSQPLRASAQAEARVASAKYWSERFAQPSTVVASAKTTAKQGRMPMVAASEVASASAKAGRLPQAAATGTAIVASATIAATRHGAAPLNETGLRASIAPAHAVTIAANQDTHTAPVALTASASAASGDKQQADSSAAATASLTDNREFAVIDPPTPMTAPARESEDTALTATASDADQVTQTAVASNIPVPQQSPASGGASDNGPFGLVMANADATSEDDDPLNVPLPASRPKDMPATIPMAPAGRSKPVEQALAYARTDDDDNDGSPSLFKRLFSSSSSPSRRAGVAIYDVSAGTVYLPSGERLEAHSGMGAMRDNPRYFSTKMRGPTPPHTYNLTLRESLFHGVQALRLTPVGGAGAVYNRVGLLAHTYMLRTPGDSNGCVVFKDYKRFLAAYRRGEIRQMQVVSRLAGSEPHVALK